MIRMPPYFAASISCTRACHFATSGARQQREAYHDIARGKVGDGLLPGVSRRRHRAAAADAASMIAHGAISRAAVP